MSVERRLTKLPLEIRDVSRQASTNAGVVGKDLPQPIALRLQHLEQLSPPRQHRLQLPVQRINCLPLKVPL